MSCQRAGAGLHGARPSSSEELGARLLKNGRPRGQRPTLQDEPSQTSSQLNAATRVTSATTPSHKTPQLSPGESTE